MLGLPCCGAGIGPVRHIAATTALYVALTPRHWAGGAAAGPGERRGAPWRGSRRSTRGWSPVRGSPRRGARIALVRHTAATRARYVALTPSQSAGWPLRVRGSAAAAAGAWLASSRRQDRPRATYRRDYGALCRTDPASVASGCRRESGASAVAGTGWRVSAWPTACLEMAYGFDGPTAAPAARMQLTRTRRAQPRRYLTGRCARSDRCSPAWSGRTRSSRSEPRSGSPSGSRPRCRRSTRPPSPGWPGSPRSPPAP